ncbi:hypothetical protein [Treponema lecithinolyticum]|nr:hypothetical protein [Treponema lecithinolyticum]
MNSEEIKERLALIGALAEDAQAGFETMLVPFLLYGIAIPAGTAATYFFVHLELAKFVWLFWLALVGLCQLFLSLYFRRDRQVKIQRASDRIFAALWGSIGFTIMLNFVFFMVGKIAFAVIFFNIGILIAIGSAVSGTLVQKKVQLLMYLESALWAACALSCLLVSPYNAPFVIAGATFALLAIPAFTGLLIMRKKKTGDER